MFGGPGKVGRGGGGGGGAGKRNIHAPPINRAVRPSMGGGSRGRGGARPGVISPPTTSSMQVEESFSLVRENPLNFGMAIKLAPDLVEEIKRVEAHGGGARIKFDVNANNPNGNVIHVGDKIFRFTWSRELGDLCDIYEERQSGEDGNGLLVESGGTWRKLNVERELDESMKNHVKRRSEEAERKLKSRKAIVLDHQNPSMKNQVKALAAAESNPWRNFNRKEPPFKKAKLDPPSGGPPKSAYKSSMPTTTFSKCKISCGSPLSSQPEQHGGPASPAGSGNLVKGRVDITDVTPTQNTNIIANSEKEMSSKFPHSIIRDKSKRSRDTEAKSADLKSLVISLLQETQSKGMSLKALEKAIGKVIPNSARQIDPILKQVAVFQSPGRYLLKHGLEKESVKKMPSQSGSSPDTNRHQPLSSQKPYQLHPQDPIFPMPTFANYEPEHGERNSTTPLHTTDDPTDKTDALQSPPQRQLRDSKDPTANSSSDSGSSSDSDSSDSGSSSPSHSPSGSESDDASISSKQASDEDVDIMSDEEPPRPEPAGPHLGDGRDSFRDTDCVSPNRFRSGNLSQPVSGTISSLFGDSPENLSPDRPPQSPDKSPIDIMEDIVNVDDNDGDSSRGSLEVHLWAEAPSGERRPAEVSRVQKGFSTEDGLVGERKASRFSLESVTGDKSLSVAESDRIKPDTSGKGKEAGPHHPSENVTSMADKLPMENGRGSVLRREYSDLELGEFREPIEDATPLPKKQIERKNSFKQMENKLMDSKLMDSERLNSDSGRRKPQNFKSNADLGVKTSPPNSEAMVSGSADGLSKRKVLKKNVDDLMRPHQRSSRPMEQHQQGWGGPTEPGPHHNKVLEMGNKSRFSDGGPDRTQISEGHGDVSKRMPVNSTEHQHDPVRGAGRVNTKVSKKQKPNVMGDLNGRRVDASLTDTNDSCRRKKESSLDEDNLFARYEKEEPELKGPIKDASQYNEYVKEYQEKYESYCSLNKILETLRDEFTKYGKDLETFNSRDMKRYQETLKQMRSSFKKCVEKHQWRQKIFNVLHEELKHLKQMIKDYAASY